MSAILSSEELNDFISPSVACIKPVENLPDPPSPNVYEVTTEDKVQQEQRTAQISLTDCLACSGCVTSAEAVLVSLQSHAEVLNTLDSGPPLSLNENGHLEDVHRNGNGKVFVASLSPQVRASLAAAYQVKESEAGAMIKQLLSGPEGLASGGRFGNKFTWVVDTNNLRDIAIATSVEEIGIASRIQSMESNGSNILPSPKFPVLCSACPGWICYAEKTHPHVLPYISKVKSPQALAGILLKSVLAMHYQIDPSQVFHLAIMPCFDKKLEASRQEFTDVAWGKGTVLGTPVRDVDCVITAREVLMLAESRGINFKDLSRADFNSNLKFPDPVVDDFLFRSASSLNCKSPLAGSSGGYLHQIVLAQQHQRPGSTVKIERGRNADVVEFHVVDNEKTVFKGARYYGFRNIQNLVRKLRASKTNHSLLGKRPEAPSMPTKSQAKSMDYSYIEVMACPGGCTNGGGQIRTSDLKGLQNAALGKLSQKEWLSLVDEAYFSSKKLSEGNWDNLTEDTSERDFDTALSYANKFTNYWSKLTGISKEKLIFTSYREVESTIGKSQQNTEKVAALASKIGGGW